MDINKSLRLAIDTGSVKFGCNQTSKAIKHGKVKMIILTPALDSALLAKKENQKDTSVKSNEMKEGKTVEFMESDSEDGCIQKTSNKTQQTPQMM